MSVLAIVPARAGSRGVPGKNQRRLDGRTLIEHAVSCALRVPAVSQVVVSTDIPGAGGPYRLERPPELAQDTTPMIDVVRHVLRERPGPPHQPIVLLQPTQPFRQPGHVVQALSLLGPGVDSVVSVVELPQSHHPRFALRVLAGELHPYRGTWDERPTGRQAVDPVYRPDGTVYAFRRSMALRGTLYGFRVRPFVVLLEESCELDTFDDWDHVVRRWLAR